MTADASGRATAVRATIDDAAVGVDDLFAGLAAVDGVGPVAVEGRTAEVTVTLPVPSTAIRERLAGEIRAAATGVDGIDRATVGWRPAPADTGERVDLLPDVKNVVAVASGKGGVGKSTVAANLAASLADAGASVGLLDADVYGPNAPALLGMAADTPGADRRDRIRVREAHGVRVMSMGFLADDDDPVIWRGPLVDDLLGQLFGDVDWGELDYLVIDLPPGSGDPQLSVVQRVPVTGAVVVTTPQPVAVDDARRGLQGFAEYGVPVLGVVENMSRFVCTDCGGSHDVFGEGGGRELAAEFEVPVLGEIPLDESVGDLAGDPADPPGVSVPLIGRLSLPRTREERSPGRPPTVLRADGGAPRPALRATATRVAARVNERVVRLG